MLFLIFLIWFIPLVLLMLWMTIKVYRYFKRLWLKVIMACLTALIFFGALFGDSIAGNYYLEYLCTTQGGPHVYQTVELGPEYWNEDGSAKFIYPKGAKVDGKFVRGINQLLTNKFVVTFDIDREKYKKLNIRKGTRQVKELSNKKVLGEYIWYTYFGGWLVNSIGFHVGGTSCLESKNPYGILVKETFKSIKN